MRNAAILIIAIVISLLPGIIGSFFTAPQIENWYQGLQKPIFNPPNWVFAPVWTLLYILMGISLYKFITAKDDSQKKLGIGIFTLQLVLNGLWSIVFFRMESMFGGLIVIVLLWLAILATIQIFRKKDTVAFYLLIPYIVWVSYAATLNLSIFLLNR